MASRRDSSHKKSHKESVMGGPLQASLSNALLRSLPAESYAAVAAHLEPVDLPLRFKLADPKQPYSWVYFPESGIASVIAPVGDTWQEIGLFGRDGVGGVAALLSTQRPSFEVIMQVAGHGHRIPLAEMARLFQQNVDVRDMVLRYIRAAFFQLSQSALANTQLNVEQRLARWLLMVHDRIDGDVIKLTHEYLAIMLGVSRTTVTLALHALERARLIGRARAQIIVADRAGLEQLADQLYRVLEPPHDRAAASRMLPQMAAI